MTASEYFSAYTNALDAFAAYQKLEVEKYRHGVPHWSFARPHPKGGSIRIDIQINNKHEVFLFKSWFFDWVDGGKMLAKQEDNKQINADVDAVVNAIELALQTVANWPLGEWTNQRAKDDVDLVAEVELFLDEDAQMEHAWHSGVRPQHRIPGRPKPFFCQLDLIDVEAISPGQSCRARASCIIKEEDRKYFVPGFCWHVCSGDRIVGYARYIAPWS